MAMKPAPKLPVPKPANIQSPPRLPDPRHIKRPMVGESPALPVPPRKRG